MNRIHLRDKFLDIFFPYTQCMVCGSSVSVEEGICNECRSAMEEISGKACAVCGIPLEDREICLTCSLHHPPYQQARSAYAYSGPARQLIRAMKYSGEFDLPARIFSKSMLCILRQTQWTPEVVLFVPSAPETLHHRGYSQAEKLAERIAAEMHLPFLRHALKKRRGTRSQVGLNRKDRKSNIVDSFQPGKQMASFVNKRVLLIDDLITTGATVQECSRVLMQHGAAAVYVLTAARVVDRKEEKEDQPIDE